MKYYELKFSLYGKKMKTTLLAESETHAKNMIKNRIVFHDVKELDDYVPNHKIEEAKKVADKQFDGIMDFLAGFKNTKKR